MMQSTILMIFFLSCEGSTLWGFCNTFLLSSVCHLSRVPWNTRKSWGFWSYRYEAGGSYSSTSPDNAVRFQSLTQFMVWGFQTWVKHVVHYALQVNVVILLIIAFLTFTFSIILEEKLEEYKTLSCTWKFSMFNA